jgi:mannose-6-phosphate isomerase-like protein (cupin superfamily)
LTYSLKPDETFSIKVIHSIGEFHFYATIFFGTIPFQPAICPSFEQPDKEKKHMTGFVGSIEKLTEKNHYFRQVVFTGKHTQLVLMCLQKGEEIGNEVHHKVDQFFRIEKGEAKFVLNSSEEHIAGEGDAVIVPAGTYHNVINNSTTRQLKLYTLYSPPNHPDGTIHRTKAEAEATEEAEQH